MLRDGFVALGRARCWVTAQRPFEMAKAPGYCGEPPSRKICFEGGRVRGTWPRSLCEPSGRKAAEALPETAKGPRPVAQQIRAGSGRSLVGTAVRCMYHVVRKMYQVAHCVMWSTDRPPMPSGWLVAWELPAVCEVRNSRTVWKIGSHAEGGGTRHNRHNALPRQEGPAAW